jgi:hypothetical protein
MPYSPHEDTTHLQSLQAPSGSRRRSSAIVGGSTFAFALSYRDVEELRAERDVLLTYEAVRYWYRKFGQTYANQSAGGA